MPQVMLRDQYVLITGCSSGGIGHALALEYHSKGLRVIATARRLESMSELAAVGIITLVLDVCDPIAVQAMKTTVEEMTGGELHIIVNNAGRSYTLPATDYELPLIRELFEVNVFAVMNMSQTFTPLLKACTHQDGAKIINIGSIAAIMPTPFGSAYNASKAALHAYGNTLRVELAPFKIKVITIVTGGVKSQIANNNPHDIPADSLYDGMRDLFSERRKAVSQRGATATAVYAAKVVVKSLKKSPPAWIWAGNYSFVTWVLHTFGWTTVWDRPLIRRFGLDIFARRLARQRS